MERKFGEPVVGWTPPPRPGAETMTGRYARIERLDADRHAADLHKANSASDSIWDYLPYGPFASLAGYYRWVRDAMAGEDPVFYAIHDIAAGHAAGVASYLRITPESGTIEVGHINLSPSLQGTRAATEAMVLMMGWAFETGYRRYEWKCDALNIPSRRAAQRLGFSYEGVFRQATIYRGRNRDTAWFAAIDKDWPALHAAYQIWLAPENFDARGQQRQRLSDLTRLARVSDDPLLR